MLDTPGAVGYLFEKLAWYGGDVGAVYRCLVDQGRQDLALRFLDAAAYHCVEDARRLIEGAELLPH